MYVGYIKLGLGRERLWVSGERPAVNVSGFNEVIPRTLNVPLSIGVHLFKIRVSVCWFLRVCRPSFLLCAFTYFIFFYYREFFFCVRDIFFYIYSFFIFILRSSYFKVKCICSIGKEFFSSEARW